MPRNYLAFARESAPDAAVDNERDQEHINEDILDNSEPMHEHGGPRSLETPV